MLDIPALAWLVWAVVAFLHYNDTRSRWSLFAFTLLFVAGLYTKQTAIFAAPAFALAVLVAQGRDALRDRWLAMAGALFFVLLIPLVYLHLEFGSVNTASALGSARADVPRWSWDAWSYYARIMPAQLGWPTVGLALFYLAGAAWYPTWRLRDRAAMVLAGSWFVFGYLFFSFIMVREPRHDLLILSAGSFVRRPGAMASRPAAA